MLKKIIYFFLVLMVSKMSGFIRDVVLSYHFGASAISDAYLVSLTIPGSIFAFVSIAIKTIFIPVYSQILVQKNEEEANKYTQKLCIVFVVVSLFLAIISIIFAQPIVSLYASGFDTETINVAVFLTRLNLLTLAFLSVEYIYEALLQAKGQYTISELTSLPANLILIVSFYCVSSWGIIFFSIGKILSVVGQLLLTIIILLIKFRYSFKLRVSVADSFKDENVKGSLKKSLPVIAGTSANEINKLIDRSVASNITVGGISSLVYANRLNSLVIEICVNSIATIEFPKLSVLASEGKISELKKEMVSGIIYMCFFLIPATAIMILFSREITTIVFGHGNGVTTIDNTSVCFYFYAFGILAVGIREMIVRGFYALGETKIPALISLLSIGINIVLDFILSEVMGFGGLAMATSVAAIFAVVSSYFALKKSVGAIGLEKEKLNIAKIFGSTLLAALCGYLLYFNINQAMGNSIGFIMSFALISIVYLVLLMIFKCTILEEIKDIVGKKIEVIRNRKV